MSEANPFALVDDAISNWVGRLTTALMTEWAGKPARFFHLPGTQPFECYQVVVLPPEGERVSINVRAIDTPDGREAELERLFEGAVEQFDQLMQQAIDQIEQWKKLYAGS